MEKFKLQNETEETFEVKLNLLFEVDSGTNKKLGNFYDELKNKFGEIIIDRKNDGLPFHFTIIGGGKISRKDLKGFEENNSGTLSESLSKLRMFNREKRIPVPTQKSQLSWHTFPYGEERILILRIKFTDGDYVLSGDRELNKNIARNLGNPNMDFSLPSHITICKFNPPKNSQIDFDFLLKEATLLFNKFEIQKNISLEPAVYAKMPTDKKFTKIDIKNKVF